MATIVEMEIKYVTTGLSGVYKLGSVLSTVQYSTGRDCPLVGDESYV